MVNVRNFPRCTCKDCEWQKSLCNELPHEDNDVICDDFCKKEYEDENLNFKEM